jgi:hypothetical protein
MGAHGKEGLVASRVTRLGEVSPIGFYFGQLFENYILNIIFFQMVSIFDKTFLTKNELRYILGEFFKNSSGRPAGKRDVSIFSWQNKFTLS